MQHTIDSEIEFMTVAFIHGVLIKGAKLMLKVWWEPLAYAGLILYSIFKTLDALFLIRRERKNMYPDPKKHCHYMNLSYVDKWVLWLKQADALDTLIGQNKRNL